MVLYSHCHPRHYAPLTCRHTGSAPPVALEGVWGSCGRATKTDCGGERSSRSAPPPHPARRKGMMRGGAPLLRPLVVGA